jgi:hypothetical protein
VGEREVDEAALGERVLRAFELGPEPVSPPQLILGTVEEL